LERIGLGTTIVIPPKWTVKLDKGDFVGRDALRRVKAEGPRRSLVGLAGADRTIPRHGSRVSRDGADIGEVTSGTYSFFLSRGVGMASVAIGEGEPGDRVEVDSRGRAGSAELVSLPIYRGSVKSPTASKN